MTEILPFLKELISAPGLSGHEAPMREIILKKWEPLVDEVRISRLGSLHALKRGAGSQLRPKIMFAAHMDAIGLMVTDLQDDFLRVTKIGGVDARVLPGQLVTVHGRNDLPGVIAMPPDRLLPDNLHGKPVPLSHLLVDTGLSARQLAKLVRVGDLISFAQSPLELQGETIAGHSLDNRASVAALAVCLEILQNRKHVWDVWTVATVQEEETLGGALTSAFDIRPELAVAVDVTFGKGPGANDYQTFELGKGVTLGWGPNIHPALYQKFKTVAEQVEIPFHREVMPRHSGTDAMALQIAAEGIPSMVLSIPLRYMHTPVELVALNDIQRAGRLLAELVTALDECFMDTLTWED